MPSPYGKTVGGLIGEAASDAYDVGKGLVNFARENPESAGLIAGQFVPGAATQDFFGNYPNPANPQEMLPSFGTNLVQGNLLDAGAQAVGLIGDGFYAVAPLTAGGAAIPGAVLSAPRAAQLAKRGGKGADTSYRMAHQPRAPQDGAARLDEMTVAAGNEGGVFPEDLYSDDGLRFYGNPKSKADQESHQIIRSVRGDADAKVTIYRAVPKGVEEINEGDFVTLSREYAEQHAGSGYGRNGDEAGQVLEMEVQARDLYSDGNDLNEFGFYPKPEPKTQAEEKARSLLDMLETGKGDEITRGDLKQADDAYLAQNYDLPMDYESRMKRADEMGYNIDMPFYRGQNTPYMKQPTDSTRLLNPMFASDNPEVAATYLPNQADVMDSGATQLYDYEMGAVGGIHGNEVRGTEGGSIFPLLIRADENTAVIDGQGMDYDNIPEDADIFFGDRTVETLESYNVPDLVAEQIAQDLNYSDRRSPVVIFENLQDIGPNADNSNLFPFDDLTAQSTIAGINDPTAVRSIFARFDPRLKKIGDLNAGLLVAPVGGAALAGGLLSTEPTSDGGAF